MPLAYDSARRYLRAMPLATYKDLCIDACDAHALASFWAGLLGLDATLDDDGAARLSAGDRVIVWVNQVSEPKSVKNRLHLDIRAESLDAALAAGATVVDRQPRWTVLTDPDGQEFCIFERDAPVADRFYELVWDVTGDVDAAHRVAQWWAMVLGGNAVREERWSYVDGLQGLPFESIVFQPVPEDKATKNRIHIDVATDDLAALVAQGAMPSREKGDDGIGWTVMIDPAGNEFCAFTPDD
jgi:hypothetical protein